MKKTQIKILVVVIVFALVVATGAILFIGLGVFGESQSAETDVHAGDRPTAVTIPPEILEKRGPRPQNTRLRDNARQVETNQDALASAEDALARVEKELAGAKDDAALARLERKKRLIEQTVVRLSGKE